MLVDRLANTKYTIGGYYNQVDYIMLKRRFWISVNTAKRRSFSGADIGSDHDLVMMNFRLRAGPHKD